jgi:hypothetical protein
MFKDKEIRKMLFGSKIEDSQFKGVSNNRSTSIDFPRKEIGESHIHIEYASDDGLVLYLLKRIIKLEEKVGWLNDKLEAKGKK